MLFWGLFCASHVRYVVSGKAGLGWAGLGKRERGGAAVVAVRCGERDVKRNGVGFRVNGRTRARQIRWRYGTV